MPMLKVRVCELQDTPEECQATLDLPECDEYEVEVPTELSDTILGLIASGLLFHNDWSADGTTSRWEVVE
jgi:hypothetical protein